ncbi:lipid IV(A) 3-deoxy-D-manno-octulosonic acid transferase [Aliiglaciecola litoralis]|uniref:3-deoxy-D-manno-octulosonic acid transferase n=2 Tax=Aliiglaciecola litoralis TaxID=582857 RepID=A0ABP3WX57_9ALTE
MFLLRREHFDLHRLSRFSLYLKPIQKSQLLIHCVSVGEVNVAASLIRNIRQHSPATSITVTTTTPTGAANVKQSMPDNVQHLYLPLDMSWFMSRLLKRVQPQKVLIVEVELWPNMLRQCQRFGIPAYLVNGRMTDSSAHSYLKLRWLVHPMLRNLTKVCAQAARDHDNYLQLGVTPAQLEMTGNVKFELAQANNDKAQQLITQLNIDSRPIIVAGSTHDPEEEVIIEAAKILSLRFPDIVWIIVPRHPQRFEKVYSLIKRSGLGVVKSSRNKPPRNPVEMVLVDEMGVLGGLYSFASIAFVGGSIADRGGHNALEPAAEGVPVMMGPHRYNNPGICDVLEQEGNLVLVDNAEDVAKYVSEWLSDDEQRRSAGKAGAQVIEQNRGAIQKTLHAVGLDK